jgi:7-cyano-7-deazaguanine synthase
MSLAVVAMSGGMDSCVAAALAQREGHDLAALHVAYGQRTEAREQTAFHAVCDALGIARREIVSIAHLRAFGGSALTDPAIAVPENQDLDRGGIPISYVPQRNGNLLFIAAAWAEVLGAETIWTGMVEEDSSGYPDCRRSFCDAIERAIAEGNHDDSPDPRIVTPLIHLTKAQIVARGLELGAPLERTWSCYQAEDVACGVCDSCRLRLRGFAQAGATDPIPYRLVPMTQPPSSQSQG